MDVYVACFKGEALTSFLDAGRLAMTGSTAVHPAPLGVSDRQAKSGIVVRANLIARSIEAGRNNVRTWTYMTLQ